jgi:quercetin dioxygenase-like cupin family protein/DNA-binding Xre family transcriptional regulator
MKLYEKIRHIRKDVLKLSLKDFHEKLIGIFGENALTYASLCRLEKGHREEIRIKTLYQICTGFGMSLKELKEGTEEEESKIVSIMKASERHNNTYAYNEKAIAEILTPRDSRFLAIELDIQPGGSTREEQDPIDVNRYEKLVGVLQGEILVYVGKEKHLVRRGDSIYFASNIPHHFENPSRKVKARCIIVQNPKSY